MDILLTHNTGTPIYEQITQQIKNQILDGRLSPGDPLPSMRTLAKSLRISVITVQRAYETLQREGFLETTVGRGSFVAAQDHAFYREEQQRQAEEHLLAAAEIARKNGIALSKLVELITMFYQEEE